MMKEPILTQIFGPHTVRVFGQTGQTLIWLPGHEETAETLLNLLPDSMGLALISGIDWDRELTPWPAPPVFGREAFLGEADVFLQKLTGQMIPETLGLLPDLPVRQGIAGYSLGGLFALYAIFCSDSFSLCASVSGSLWYDGFLSFAKEHAPKHPPERIFLSVGDREARTRYERMRPVEENTRLMADVFRAFGSKTYFKVRPGGHFDKPEAHLAEGIRYLMGEDDPT